jgi:hypothetical protein
VAHVDIKAMRFVTTVDALIKKDMHEVFLAQQGTNTTNAPSSTSTSSSAPVAISPFADPHRSILSGGVVNGAAWCQLGGSVKRQQFALMNFSEAKLLARVSDTGVKGGLVAVCRTVHQNCQHEFVFRGCDVHCLPGMETILFPSPSAATATTQDGEEQTATATTTTTKGKSMLALPIFELCSRKNLGANDNREWLEVVGDGRNQQNSAFSAEERKQNAIKEQQHQTQLASLFNEAVVDIARNNGAKARSALERIQSYDPEAQFLPAFQNLSQLINKMSS